MDVAGQLAGVDQAIVHRHGAHGSPEIVVALQLVAVLHGGRPAIVPDDRRIRVWLSLDGGRFGVLNQLGRYVASLGRLDAPKMTNPFVMLRVLAGTDDDLVADNYRRGDEVALGAATAELILGILGIGVEFPDELAGLRLEGIEPAVAAGKDDL